MATLENNLPSSTSYYAQRISGFFAVVMGLVLPISTAATEIAFYCSLFFALFSGRWHEMCQAILHNRIALMFVVFSLAFWLGITYTDASTSAIVSTIKSYNRFLLAISLFIIFKDRIVRDYALKGFFAVTTATLIISYIKFFAGTYWPFGGTGDSSLFKDHIFTSLLLAFACYWYALLSLEKSKWRGLYILAALLALYNVFFINLGRSGYVVSVMLLGLLAWQKFRWKGLAAAFIVLSFLISMLMMLSHNFKKEIFITHTDMQRFSQGSKNTSTGLRMDFISNSVKLIRAHPLLGTGTGSFEKYYATVVESKELMIKNPHNEYLNVTVQLGLAGLFILLLLFYSHWKESFKLPDSQQYLAQAVLIAIATGSLFNSWLKDSVEGFFYIYLTALLFSDLARVPQVRKE